MTLGQKKRLNPDPISVGRDTPSAPSATLSGPTRVKETADTPTAPPETKPPIPTEPTEQARPEDKVSAPIRTEVKSMGVTETPSIFLQKKKEQNATPSEPNSEKRNQPFTEASLQQAWAQFAQQQQADFGETEKLILSRNISKGEGHKVMIALLSQLEVSFLEKLELEITQTLRNALENDFITLERVIVEDEGSKGKKLYTDKDIFDHMSQENPHLLTLKDKLGLDFDY